MNKIIGAAQKRHQWKFNDGDKNEREKKKIMMDISRPKSKG